MDTSVTIIGLVLTLIIAAPILYNLRSTSLNKSKINAIKDQFSQNNHFNFEIVDKLNKKILALDDKNKGFLLMDFNTKSEKNSFVNLNDVQSCKLVLTTANNGDTTNSIVVEFQYKENKKTESVPFYKIENDQMGQICLYEDYQLAKKWKAIFDSHIKK